MSYQALSDLIDQLLYTLTVLIEQSISYVDEGELNLEDFRLLLLEGLTNLKNDVKREVLQ
jgi:hypothetical protein